ncbi:TraB/GumN family protein [Halomarina oriensis]|uniref:Conjugal transfer protein TraB n=1 Tax=Halomarina oriensis TaxID=671145 RepID=A0A6B0GP05_9EURY|nr:TraB/GumN family protein [Halomarina oriensis]MWG33875.1 conjugal transfer protein TraB [Halomarina oriensis]
MSEQATERGSVRVVGTAHVSADSVDEVERVIAEERPEVVAVELDEGRYRQMQGDSPEDLDASDLLRGNTVFQFLAYWMLSYVQTRMGEQFDIQPGADMLAAIDAAEEHGTDVALVDRDIQVTIQRFWTRLSGVEKLKLVAGLSMSIAPPREVGAMAGGAVGLFLGMLAGTFFSEPLGLNALAAGIGPAAGLLGGLVVGLVVGVALFVFVGDLLPDRLEFVTKVAACVVGGLALGVGVWVAGGVAVGPLDLSVATLDGIGQGAAVFGLGLLGGVVLFGMTGALVGTLLGASMHEEEYEELDMESLTDTDVVSVMMDEFRQFSPDGASALIDERDAYIAHNLVSLRNSGKRVVAVVGAGHRAGIENYLDHPEQLPPMADLTGRESGSRFSFYKLFGYLFTLGFAVAFGLLAMAGAQNQFLFELFAAWFLFNGVFAFGLARIAGAHWPSAAVGGAIAWLTSLNPLLAPGWFAGYVELRYANVNVGDIGKLNELLGDEDLPVVDVFTQMREVPLFRLILVVALTNIGSMVASFLFPFVVLPYLSQDVDGVAGVVDLMYQGLRNSIDLVTGGLAL